MLFTIYKGKPVGSWFRQRISGKAKFKTGKFRPGIAFTMYTNQLHLPKNSRERLKLVLIKDGFEEIELEFPFGTFRPEKQDFQTFRYSRTFSTETTQKVVLYLLSSRISRNVLKIVNNHSDKLFRNYMD